MIKHLYEKPIYIPYSEQDRLIIYKDMEKQLSVPDCYASFCHTLGIAMRRLAGQQSTAVLRQPQDNFPDFPELLAYKPKELVFSSGDKGGLFWFPLNDEGKIERLRIIAEVLITIRKELYG